MYELNCGVYAKSFYTRKIYDPTQQNVYVPVAFEFQYVTVYYSDSSMQDPIYLDVFGDPPIRLDNYNLNT